LIPDAEVKILADVQRIRVYIRYETLLAADLLSVLKGIERAYNWTDSFLRKRGRVHPGDRLQLTSIGGAGENLTITLTGYSSTITTLGYLIHLTLKERALDWQGQKTQWEAKSAEAKFHQRDNQEAQRRIETALREENPNLMRALRSVHDLGRKITLSPRMAKVEMNFAVEEGPANITAATP
jgi:hypothetical protein